MLWGSVQSSRIVEIYLKFLGPLALASYPYYFGWVSWRHTIQISDRRPLLPPLLYLVAAPISGTVALIAFSHHIIPNFLDVIYHSFLSRSYPCTYWNVQTCELAKNVIPRLSIKMFLQHITKFLIISTQAKVMLATGGSALLRQMRARVITRWKKTDVKSGLRSLKIQCRYTERLPVDCRAAFHFPSWLNIWCQGLTNGTVLTGKRDQKARHIQYPSFENPAPTG